MNRAATRKALFTPCKSKQELDRWIRVFLNIRLPDKIVSDESNTSPMNMIWDLYDRAVRNDTEGWKRSMSYANRFGGKTLGASILETVLLLHTGRNIIHMAAIVDQSKKAQEYVKGFFDRDHLRDFKVGDNAKEIVIVAYIHRKTGVPITLAEFDKLAPAKQEEYKRKDNYVRIIACTMQSTNGQHGELFIVDEVDVIEKKNLKAYAQAKGGIPTSKNGMTAMTLFTSTRKSRIGKVQEEIDNAKKTGLVLRHWNIIDITEPCKPSRHQPEKPKQTYWINDASVTHIDDAAYDRLPETERSKWYAKEGYAGCQSCPLFAACKGRLATEQSGTVGAYEDGGTALLLPITDVIDLFRAATPEFITTEYLCRKPDTSGLVYPRLSEDIHLKTPAQIAEMVLGEPSTIETKEELISLLVHAGARFASGMDFGYNHLFAVATVAIWGNLAFVVDATGKAQQELDDKLYLTEHLKALNSAIYPDPEDAGTIATFKRKGYRIKEWSKGPGSVKAGYEIVRAKLWSRGPGATLFFLKCGDPELDLLFKHTRDYKFSVDVAGSYTDVPDEDNDDLPDALRYVIMNIFGKNGGLKDNLGLIQVSAAHKEMHWTEKVKKMNNSLLTNVVSSLTGGQSGFVGIGETQSGPKTKKGSFSMW